MDYSEEVWVDFLNVRFVFGFLFLGGLFCFGGFVLFWGGFILFFGEGCFMGGF